MGPKSGVQTFNLHISMHHTRDWRPTPIAASRKHGTKQKPTRASVNLTVIAMPDKARYRQRAEPSFARASKPVRWFPYA